MLQKFVKISRVGKFSDCAIPGSLQLRRANLIFGENGRGKSTLAAILRSLQTGDGDHITERMTLHRTGKPEVHLILEGNKPAKFKDGKWDCSPAAIEIFDINFVYDNINIGHVVDHDHKRNLFKIIVGDQGVKLSEKVDELDEAIRKINPKIRAAKDVVEAKIDGGMKIDDFIAIAKVEDIDKQIKAQELKIASQQNSNDIAMRDGLAEITLPAVPDTQLLSRTIEDVSADAEALMSKHIAENLGDGGEEWIGTGYDYLADRSKCPFCGQGVDASDLIAAYKAHFNEAYAELKVNIASLARQVDTAFGTSALLTKKLTISDNGTAGEFWKKFITFKAPELEFTSIESQWKELAAACTECVSQKAAAPLEVVDPSARLQAAIAAYAGVVTLVDGYNTAVRSINESVAAKKAETASGNLAAELAVLSKLKNTKIRHDTLVAKLVGNYQTEVAAKGTLEQDKDKAKDDLDIYANQIFSAYQTELNNQLSNFGAEFQIEEGTRSFVGGKPSWTYHLRINKQSVPLADKKGKASMRNTLSIGDRSALALAFFLTKLSHDPNLKDKCVVFDDPVCSLDRFRMECSVNEIVKIAKAAKQVLVLCHDPYVLKKIYDRIVPQKDVLTLCVERHVTDSQIAEWDIEEATRSQYFQDYVTLANYVAVGRGDRELRDIARKIRPLIEENLRVRFPDKFSKGWLGDFISAIRDAPAGDSLEGLKSQLEILAAINDYSKRYHHSENPPAEISETELMNFTNKAFEFIRGAA